jgi:hypothetical protein
MKTYVNLWKYLAAFFLEWEMFQTDVVQKTKTQIVYSTTIFFFENRAVYEIMWKNRVYSKGPQMKNITWYMRSACLINKATDTHSEYLILTDFP